MLPPVSQRMQAFPEVVPVLPPHRSTALRAESDRTSQRWSPVQRSSHELSGSHRRAQAASSGGQW